MFKSGNEDSVKIAYYLNCVSAHEIPVVLEMVKLVGYENVVYIDGGLKGQSYQTVDAGKDIGVRVETIDSEYAQEAVETWDVMITGIRNVDLFKRRHSRGLMTLYGSERWFKPPIGQLRMLVPGYRRMVKRFVAWVNEDPLAGVLAEGPWAKRDFIKIGVQENKIIPWGYFVSPGAGERCNHREPGGELKALWAGRDIPLKHVKDIEKAVDIANKNISKSTGNLHSVSDPISFTKLTGVGAGEVRQAMREHDVFVFASNGYEGWGAVVSEALEEGMNVIGTWECGSCPTMLPVERLFHCGDVKALAKLLEREFCGALPACSIGDWTAEKAAKRLHGLCVKCYN